MLHSVLFITWLEEDLGSDSVESSAALKKKKTLEDLCLCVALIWPMAVCFHVNTSRDFCVFVLQKKNFVGIIETTADDTGDVVLMNSSG